MFAGGNFSNRSIKSVKAECAKKKCTLWVWVLDETSKESVVGALVNVDGPAKLTGKMPKKGPCVFDNLTPDTYLVTASAVKVKGYEKSNVTTVQPVSVTIAGGDTGTATLMVQVPFEEIAIQLVDREDKPVAVEAFELTTPKGHVLASKLTASGFMRVRKIRPGGECKIRFPEIDGSIWEFVSSTPGTDAPLAAAETVTLPALAASPVTVARGDCVSSISTTARMPVDRIWTAGQNKVLKDLRKDPCVLMADDKVVIPKRMDKAEYKETGSTHKFRLKDPRREYRLQILMGDKVREDVRYEVVIDGKPAEVKTTGPWVTFLTQPDDKEAVVTLYFTQGDKLKKVLIEKREYKIRLGHLRPVDTPEGQEDRLRNLGYYSCWPNGKMPTLQEALQLFQLSNGIDPANGKPSEPTLKKLRELTGDPGA